MTITTRTAFTPDAVAAINRAYVDACELISAEASADAALRSRLAERILHLARLGETDAHRLCSLAVLEVIGRPPTVPAGVTARPQRGRPSHGVGLR